MSFPVVPDVVLRLVVFPGEIASRALAGDFNHGELFTVAGEITGRLAWTAVPGVLLLLCCSTMEKEMSQICCSGEKPTTESIEITNALQHRQQICGEWVSDGSREVYRSLGGLSQFLWLLVNGRLFTHPVDTEQHQPSLGVMSLISYSSLSSVLVSTPFSGQKESGSS